MTISFSRLTIRNWRQFRYVNMRVHDRATIITGANGAGKSTILGVFGQHLGFARPLVGTPNRSRGGGWTYDSGFFEVLDDDPELEEPQLPLSGIPIQMPGIMPGMPPHMMVGQREIGRLTYTNDVTASLNAPTTANAYGLNIVPMQPVSGMYISSHRIVAPYQQVVTLSLQSNNVDQLYGNYINEQAVRFAGQQTQFSPLYRLKEAILSLAAFGQGNDYLEGNERLLAITKEFERVLRIMLPDELGFRTFAIRMPDVVLITNSGEFVLDASSGGINAIVELAWQILLFVNTTQATDRTVVVMDEPENHLHPSMQRTLLPKLLMAFPKIQFIIATHSPFIVSSVEDSYVYALRYKKVGMRSEGQELGSSDRVVSVLLDKVTKAGNASDILREVLGVPVTFPDWANERVDKIVSSMSGSKVDRDAVAALRRELEAAGLSEYFPQALERLVLTAND